MSARGALLVATVGAVLAGVGTAGASHQPGAGGSHDFAVGSAKNRAGEFTTFPFQLEVSAHSRSATDVSGHVRGSGDLTGDLPLGDFKVEGEVTCLRVEPKPALDPTGPGTRASIKYRFKDTSGSFAPPEGGGVEVYIEDNGDPRNGQPVDGNGTGVPLGAEEFEASDPEECSNPNLPPAVPYNPIDSGNYVVHDGTTP
jgi:hypothetical protein